MEGAGGRDQLDAYHPGPPPFLKVLVLNFRYMAYLHPLPRESIRDKVKGMEVDLTDGWERPLGPVGIRGQGPLGGDQGAVLLESDSAEIGDDGISWTSSASWTSMAGGTGWRLWRGAWVVRGHLADLWRKTLKESDKGF